MSFHHGIRGKRLLECIKLKDAIRYGTTSKYANESAERRSTVDPEDVSHHSKLHEAWWKVTDEMIGLHALNRLRVPFVRDGLTNLGSGDANNVLPLRGVTIADIGCGGGIFTEALARIGATVTGVDASPQLIETARNHAKLDRDIADRISYECTTVEDFSLTRPQQFDAVVASEILEHVKDKSLFLQSCVAAIKPGGSLFITTPGRTIFSWVALIVVGEYIAHALPVGTHEWDKFISPDETRRILKSYGCDTVLVHGTLYNLLKNEWYWTTSTAIHYVIHAVKKNRHE
ncbi:ubiquinone biosynthesis O-methyltransferase, mitochondrial [Orussus abietinus]|uniref:ubiquinone biosynthesis O-methyltransferase, mitochondrial n=1 Tax=Orussus abietinus TaxID=222816 RepID=UPI000625AB1A|nr:ubiquinone biosynthesis O-methyltransferase, mitochondrial [Orussus abietinus]